LNVFILRLSFLPLSRRDQRGLPGVTPDWNEMKEPATTLPPMANENYAAFVEFEEENAGFERREALPEPRHVTTVFSARKKKGEATGATSDDEREWSRASEKLQI
jgi:hypothetical protein